MSPRDNTHQHDGPADRSARSLAARLRLQLRRPATAAVVALLVASLTGAAVRESAAGAAQSHPAAAQPRLLPAPLDGILTEVDRQDVAVPRGGLRADPTAAPRATPAPSPQLPQAVPVPPPLTVVALAQGGIPLIALQAYQRAAASTAKSDPQCGLTWPLLAAIGRVESNHGRFGGAVIYPNGLTAPRILGPALDGVSTALIRDTDHGVLDGDVVYDRAVGPMQFIPSTWKTWGVDGNGDGVADPSNLFDAALSAAHYLCAAAGEVATPAGMARAVLAYNHSATYLATVLGLEVAYATGKPAVLPVAVPVPTTPPRLPPASPGRPPGISTPTVTPTPTPTPTAPTPTPSATPLPSDSPSPSDPASPSPEPGGSPTPSESPQPSDAPAPGATPTGASSTDQPASDQPTPAG
ncbi:Membrane-bound lytic murein transglycosylase B [Frankineae bacterium MT45]|nr:Membrane-bound lytic murein transglycosylase B [Frankineae bacterium MT45]